MTTEKARREMVKVILCSVKDLNDLTDRALEQGLCTTVEVDDNGNVIVMEIDRVYYAKKKEEE